MCRGKRIGRNISKNCGRMEFLVNSAFSERPSQSATSKARRKMNFLVIINLDQELVTSISRNT